MAYNKDELKISYLSQENQFEEGNILTHEHMDNIDAALIEAASAQQVADKLNSIATQIETNQTNINKKANLNQGDANAGRFWCVDDDGNLKLVSTDKNLSNEGSIADAHAVGEALKKTVSSLSFNDDTKTLHVVYKDGTSSEDGIAVATDLTGYATEEHVENRLDIGTAKTVKSYVNEQLETIDVTSKLGDYYNKDQIDAMDLEALDQGTTVAIGLIGANGNTKYATFPKTTESSYYRISSVTKSSFNTIIGNNKTPQKIQYKTGYMDNGTWQNGIYFEKWTTYVGDEITNTITRTNYFIDMTGEAAQEFDFTPYIGDGTTTIVLDFYIANDYSQGSRKGGYTWQVTKVDFDLLVTFPNPTPCGTNSTVQCSLPAGIEKTLILTVDGEEYDKKSLAPGILSYGFSLTSSQHGAKLIQVSMEAEIDGETISAIPQYNSVIWYDISNPTPIIATRQTDYSVDLYDIVPINFLPYAYFDGSDKNKLNFKVYSDESGVETLIADETVVSGTTRTWDYPAETLVEGRNITLKLVLSHEGASTELFLTLSVEEGDYDFSPVSGESFSFLPKKYSNNNFLTSNIINISPGVTLTLGENFNLNSGGFGKTQTTSYFKIPAYNRAYITGKNLFNSEHDSHFKLVFSTQNVRENDAIFLATCSYKDGKYTPSTNGVKLTTHHGYVRGNDTVVATSVFTTDEIIDYAFNVVNPTKHENKTYTTANNEKIPSGYREGDYKDLTLEKYMIMPYEDGVSSLPAVYSDQILAEGMFENVGDYIEIGSDDCDVYIYTMRCYNRALGIDDICKNFVSDGPTLAERRARYDRNNWSVLTNNILKNPKLASKLMPEVKIVLISAPYFTNDKKDEVEDTYIQVIQDSVYRETKEGREKVDNKPYNWITQGGMHCGQGTSSNAYGFSGRNLTIKLGSDVYSGATDIFTGKNETEFNNFVTNKTLTSVDSKKVAIRPDSIAVNQFNIKVNIASSENQNNALMARLYEKLLKEVYNRPAKVVDPRVKDTMDFDNCLIYVRETTQVPDYRREFLVGDEGVWHFYALGNFGDHKKTDVTRVDNKWDNSTQKWELDPLETVVEIMDYDVALCGFNSVDDICGVEPFNPASKKFDEDNYEHVAITDYKKFGDLFNYTTTFDNGSGPETRLGIYKWDDEDKKYAFEGFGAISAAVAKEKSDGSKTYEEDLQYSYEFRYEKKGLSNEQRDINIRNWIEFYSKIEPLYTKLKNGTFTPLQAKDELSKFMIVDTAILFYLFTERFSLIDNRAKNTFWHYSKKFYSSAEVTNMPTTLKESLTKSGAINDAQAAINNGYRWDLCFGYDFDTSLGIDNVGKLAFEYGQETKDLIFRTKVKIVKEGKVEITEGFNYFFEIINNFGYSILSSIYNKTSELSILFGSSGSKGTLLTWDNAQKQFPEKVWLRDIERKYIRTSGNYQVDGSITALSGSEYNEKVIKSKEKKDDYLIDKANGLKRYHRRDFEKKQSIYMGSRWAEGSRSDYVDFRFDKSPSKVTVGFAQKCYYSTTTELSGSNWTEPIPSWTNNQNGSISYVKDISIGGEALRVYPASEITVLNFPTKYPSTEETMVMAQGIDINKAKKLSEISFGTTDGTIPKIGIGATTFDNCPMLEKVNVTNCISYENDGEFAIYLINNIGFRELLAENSGLVTANFAPNGMLQTAKLNKIKKLSLINLSQLNVLNIQNTDEMISLRLENCPLIDSYNLISQVKDSLEELRLIGINWNETAGVDLTEANLFDELALLKGINEQGNTISKEDPKHRGSVLSGKAKVYKFSTRIETLYNSWWPEMEFDEDVFITEIPVIFYEYDGINEFDRQWLVAGQIPTNPATPTRKPQKPMTERETYEFEKWDNETIFDYGISETTYVYPLFVPSPREYTVIWKGVNGSILQEDKVQYEQGAEFNYAEKGYPQKDSNSSQYFLFKGWNKYPYCVKEDNLVLTPEFSSGTPAGSPTDGIIDNIATLNAVCRFGSQNNQVHSNEVDGIMEYSVYEQSYCNYGEKIFTTIGWDPDDDPNCPEDRKPVFDLMKSPCAAYKSTSKTAAATQYDEANPIATIDNPLLLNHLNSSPLYVDTGITLFDEGDDEFTIILDYRFNDTEIKSGDFKTGTTKNKQKLLSCGYEDSKSGSYLELGVGRTANNNDFYAFSGNSKQNINHTMGLGDAGSGTYTIADATNEASRLTTSPADLRSWSGSHADRLILRKKSGSSEIEVFPSFCWYIKDEWSQGITGFIGENGARMFTIPLEGQKKHNGTVVLGTSKRYSSSSLGASSDFLCNATINGLKIWKIALSDIEVEKAVNYPKEKLQFWLTEFPRKNAAIQNKVQYSLNDADTFSDSLFPGVILELRDFLKNSRQYEGYIIEDGERVEPKNFDGWMKTATRKWLNTRILQALPLEWQSAIKPARIFQLVGTPSKDEDGNELASGTYVVDATHFDRLFNPSYQEMVPTAQEGVYGQEAAPASIAYTSATRNKYYQVAGKWYNAFNRTRTPLTTSTGYWRIEPTGGLGHGSSPNYKAWVTFAFCV